MTEGIIQQTFKKIISKHKDTVYSDVLAHEELEELQKELIEKIKQEINIEIEKHFSPIEACCIKVSNILQILIGDNQE